MKIFLRIPKGWSKPVENQNRGTCDLDEAKLWIGPGGQIYCDLEHNSEDVSKLQNQGSK
jgi:hypothetical protein